MKKWQPWADYNEVPEIDLSIPIAEPPCKHCALFRPEKMLLSQRGKLTVGGTIICHANTMLHDFSCFKPNDTDE